MNIVPRTELIGDPDRYVKAESTVILRCVVRGALEPPAYIIWYHGSKQLFGTSSSISKLNGIRLRVLLGIYRK